MFPLYSLFVLFFIFKYCNIVINSYIGLARLMLMHAIGTSLAFWIYTIVRETVVNFVIEFKLIELNETFCSKMRSTWKTTKRKVSSDEFLNNFKGSLNYFCVDSWRNRKFVGEGWKRWLHSRAFLIELSRTRWVKYNLQELCALFVSICKFNLNFEVFWIIESEIVTIL